MSTLSRFLLLPLLIASWAVAPAAQAQKIGYTNQEAILANMPEMGDVQQQLQQIAQQQQQELQQEQQEFQQQVQRYQRQQSLLSDSVASRREQQLRQRQQQLQQSMQQREQQLRQREAELMQPLLEELQSAIDSVAQAESIDMVVRTQALLYVNQSSSNVVDITPQVAERLGIDISGAETEPQPTVNNPGAPPNGGGQ